jgi:1,4-dihydroxy-2-naphthoate octaprenyltransferase
VLGAWFYTGGPRPYGYLGLGEVAVFVFFGVVAVAGSAFVEMERLSWLGLAASVPAGLLSCALLMINNLRDIKSDPLSGKRTLAVRLGDPRSRIVYLSFLLMPFVLAAALAVARPWALLTLLALPLAVPPLRLVRGGATGSALVTALGQTSRLQMAFGLALAIGLTVRG